MKEVKEEIKREVVDIHTYYEAIDGSKFTNADACKEYEDTAKCVIKSKVNKLKVGEAADAWDLMGGMDEHEVVALKPTNQTELDNLKQFFLSECPWYISEERKEKREEVFRIMDAAFEAGDAILFGLNCNGEYYFINSRQNIIDNLNNLSAKDK